jgi:hypothetical protein
MSSSLLDSSPSSQVPAKRGLSTGDFKKRPRILGWMGGLVRQIGSGIDGLMGLVTLLLGLAVVATLPIANLLSLGYLLEASRRVAVLGRLRDGFVGVRAAARLGWLLAGISGFALVLWYVSQVWQSWLRGLVALSLLVALHVWSACLRGGRLRHFLWPRPIFAIRCLHPKNYGVARDAVWHYVTGLRLPYYFWLGLRGFAGAFVWLFVPVTLLAIGSQVDPPAAVFFILAGGVGLAFVLFHLPFLQTRLAIQNNWRAQFEVRANRQMFARAPWAYVTAMLFVVALTLPLLVFKIEIIPREAAWLPSMLFVLSIFPARLLVGWAYHHAQRRHERAHWLFRTSGRLLVLPVALAYVLLVFLSQYVSWYGIASLYEQHAFMVPVPFLGL